MKRILAVIAVLFAACAPEVPTMAETSGGEQGAAGSVGADKEAILPGPVCNSQSVCDKQRDWINVQSGITWNYSFRGCGTSMQPWQASAAGGSRLLTGSLLDYDNIYDRYFQLSQQWNRIVHCKCVSSGNVSCSW